MGHRFKSSKRQLCVEEMYNCKYAILGTDALGGFYGAKFQQAGLFVESKGGDFILTQVNA